MHVAAIIRLAITGVRNTNQMDRPRSGARSQGEARHESAPVGRLGGGGLLMWRLDDLDAFRAGHHSAAASQ